MRIRLVFLAVTVAALAPAQEFRASISGLVTDASGAAVANAAVVAANVATNITITTRTGAEGRYVLAQVPSGSYTVSCEAAGFKKTLRSGVILDVGDRVTINIALELGTQTESVTVTAEVAAIDTDHSVLSQLMDNKSLSELPLNGRQVFMLAQLSNGTIFTQQQFGASGFSCTRAWDTNGSLTMQGGAVTTNQFALDGASINAGTGEWKFAPLVDGIQEFKVSTPSSDASLGLSGGGVMNMTMKSGTNQFHGTASEYIRNNIFDAVATQTNQSPIRATQHQWNDFSGLVTGPIRRNKLFFSGWYEGFRERVPFPVTQTVPSELERAGDFSDTRNASGQLIVIYDPMSTVASGSGFARTPFTGNKIPGSLQSPISQNIMQFFPHSNAPGNPYTRVNNWVSSPNIGKYGYNAWYSKFDYVWNQNQRTTGSVSQDWGFEYRASNGIQNSPAKSGNDPLRRINYGSSLDHVWTVNSTTVVDIRAAWQRYINYSAQEVADVFDGSSLGWKVPIGSSPTIHFPQLAYSGYLTMGTGGYTANRIFWPDQAYSLSGTVSKTLGKHFLKVGTQVSDTRPNRYTSGWTYGNFAFDGGFTRRDPQTSDSTSGNSIASFLLGAVASGNTDVNASSAARFHTYSLYVQDDLKLTSRLSLNLGLRWDLQTPITERFDRMVIGFDPTSKYALGNSTATGGLLFAGPGHRTSWDAKKTGFQPRLGVAYLIKPRLVMRAAYGITYVPLGGGTGGLVTVRQNGYSRSTSYVATSGGGVNSYIPNLPGNSTWTNPFPAGVLQPYGNSLGVKTTLGTGVTYDSPDYTVPYVHQFSFGFEYELPWWKTTLEASYVGSRTRHLTISQNMDAISLQNRLQCFADTTYCTKSVTNPFAGAPELVGTSLYNATMSNNQAMLPYPQFTGVTQASLAIGNQTGDLLEIRANKRVSHGLMANVSYTFGKIIMTRGFREAQYTTPYRTLADYDRAHHVGLTLQYDLPFGKGKRWLSGASGVVEKVVGGWEYNTSLEYMTGTPTGRPDAFNVANPALPSGQQTYNRWFNTCTLLANGQRANCASPDEPIVWVQMTNSYQLRTYDDRFPNLRNPWATQVNMSMFKNFKITERTSFQFRAEAFNAFNTTIYQGPDTGLTSNSFGRVTIAQQNFPRSMQFAFRLSF